jgi:tetratricopeptide (TPR) repeat protein
VAKKPAEHSAGSAAPAKRSLLGRLSGLPGWLKARPLRGGLVALVGLLVIGGLAAATSALLPAKSKSSNELIEEALAKLDAGDHREARRLAAQARAVAGDAQPADGETLYVLGTALADDARQDLNPTERRTLNLIAARYLEDAQFRGIPEDRQLAARLLLGRCLHDGGRYAAAIPVLKSLQVKDPAQARAIHELLADCYLRITPPALDKALAQNELLLAIPGLTERDKDLARLQQSQILFEQKHWARGRELLAAIGETSSIYPEAVLLSARMALGDISKLDPAAERPTELVAECDTLLPKLRKLQESDSAAPEVVAQAQLLIALCNLGKGNDAEALSQFARVRRAFAGRPESLVAMLYEAELQQRKGDAAQSLALYQRLVQEAGVADAYHNPLLPLSELDTRLTAAFNAYVAANQFAEAVTLGTTFGPLLSDVRRAELAAKAHRAWGLHLLKTAPAELAPRDVVEAEARDHFREAGLQLEELAELRIATRHYLEDLSASAQSYLDGHGFRQAIGMYRLLLAQDPSQNRPEALTGLGEALLSAGDAVGALKVLTECRELFPDHPATYRARFLAAEALEEQGKIAEAQELLSDNLYKHALTPQSVDWRDSLFALGNLLYRFALMQEARSRNEGVDDNDLDRRKSALADLEKAHTLFVEAQKTLTEAIKRYPTAPQSIEARYRIAECFRHAAKWPRKRLSIITIETTRVALHRQMQQDLQSAVDEYSQLIAMLGDDKEAFQTPLHASILRNAYFARGDALFDLGRYEDAIKAYAAATNRFQHEPESLEAYVQIAACYRRLNRPVEARGTLEQARLVLGRIKADADFSRTTTNTREEWSQLLTWLAAL